MSGHSSLIPIINVVTITQSCNINYWNLWNRVPIKFPRLFYGLRVSFSRIKNFISIKSARISNCDFLWRHKSIFLPLDYKRFVITAPIYVVYHKYSATNGFWRLVFFFASEKKFFPFILIERKLHELRMLVWR